MTGHHDLSYVRIADLETVLSILGISLRLHKRDGRYTCNVRQWGQIIGVSSTENLAETISLALAGPLSTVRGIA